MRRMSLLLLLWLASVAHPQWQLQDSHTTADLRGVDNVGKGVAWASGSRGTILRTLDGGATWQACATPPDAEGLDFRGVQAFGEETAFVMSSGKGPLSMVFKTTDGCHTWMLSFPDPYGPEGFFDAMLFLNERTGLLFGDPTSHRTIIEAAGDFRLRQTTDGGMYWVPISDAEEQTRGHGLHPLEHESAFAASNSSIAVTGSMVWIGTSAGRVVRRSLWPPGEPHWTLPLEAGCAGATEGLSMSCGLPWAGFLSAFTPLRHNTPSSGIFSLHFRNEAVGLAVGGDYREPNARVGTAAYSKDGGSNWIAPATPPHGYRSAIAYDPTTNTWITVGPNGTDISTDDGRNWRALKPSPGDDPEADQHWNALSLPFVVGPHGRSGVLRSMALAPSQPGHRK